MSGPAEWAVAFARQADADFKAWELYEKHPEAVAAECHKLLFLQMACEKLGKAYLIQAGGSHQALQKSHGYIKKPLPLIMTQQIIHMGQKPEKMRAVLSDIRHLLGEIELLNPTMRGRDDQRPDNCEYPWEIGDQIISPLTWSFQALRLCAVPSGRIFIKLLRGAIDRIISELEK